MMGEITVLALLAMFITFVATKAVGGIISEYAKRVWFQKTEPFLAKHFRPKAEIASVQSDNEAVNIQDIEYLHSLNRSALNERDYWRAEAMRLRAELQDKKAA